MAFGESVKREALNLAARHCCVCHRYKGAKVEVHHITPSSEGGTDDPDNAIVLCFDCHAEAGHYNDLHPRGTKYSAKELRSARDLWHSMVCANSILQPREEQWAYVRYLVSRTFGVTAEVVEGDLAWLPVEKPMLVENRALEYMRMLVRIQGPDRGPSVYGDSFTDAIEFQKEHPNVRIFPRSTSPHYPYFRTFRSPDESELRARVVPEDPLTGLLLDAGARPDELCLCLGYDEICGADRYQEVYMLRPAWAVFMEIRSEVEAPLALSELRGELSDSQDFRGLSVTRGKPHTVNLPKLPLHTCQSVIVPLGVALGPLKNAPPAALSVHTSDLDGDQYQEVSRVDYSSLTADLAVVGPFFWPESICAVDSPVQEVHELDLRNLFTVDRYWAAGSCPHLFLRSSDGDLTYQGEIFAAAPDTEQEFSFIVQGTVSEVLIAELELEVTLISRIQVSGLVTHSTLQLKRGDLLRIPVSQGDQVIVRGKYVPRHEGRQDPLYKNELVRRFAAAIT